MSPAKKTATKSSATAANARRRSSRVVTVTDAEPATPIKLSPDKVAKRKYTKRQGLSTATRLQNWNYTHVPPNNEERAKNGRQKGRMLVNWTRPRMMEKVLLHLQYETTIRGISIPWNNIAHRLVPGSSGDALLQRMARLRNELIAEGHLVPPLAGKSGKFTDPMVRGLVRTRPNDPNALLTTREVRFDEPFEDLEFNDPTGYMLVHNGEADGLDMVIKDQSSADSDKDEGPPVRASSSRLRGLPQKSMRESPFSDDDAELDGGDEADDEFDPAATPTTPYHKMPFFQNAGNSFFNGQRPVTPSPMQPFQTPTSYMSISRASSGTPSFSLPTNLSGLEHADFGGEMFGPNAMDVDKALKRQQATRLALHPNYHLLCRAAGILEADEQREKQHAEWLLGHPNINSLLQTAGMTEFTPAPIDLQLAAEKQAFIHTTEQPDASLDPFKLSP